MRRMKGGWVGGGQKDEAKEGHGWQGKHCAPVLRAAVGVVAEHECSSGIW